MKAEWFGEFREEMIRSESKAAPKVREYLRENYKRTSQAYSHDKGVMEIAREFIKGDDARNLLDIVYKDVYGRMGFWNTRKYMVEKQSFAEILEWLRTQAVSYANIQALTRGPLLESSNIRVIARVIEKMRENPEFLTLNENKAVIELYREFRKVSKRQAATIVRTEATNAANQAVIDSTQRIFPGRVLNKMWISSKDSRTRREHRKANGQIVVSSGDFFVGGELLTHPGSGSKPENSINCRCAIALTRKPPNQNLDL